MIELDMIFLAIIFWILFVLLMVINYKGFTRYPDRYFEQNPFGAGILKSRGPVWFVVYKSVTALAVIAMFIPFSLFFPARYSYTYLGFFIGFTWLNLYHDYLTYKQATKSEQKE